MKALSIKEVCKDGPFKPTKLYELINSGQLPAKKYGRKTVILESDLNAFLSSLPAYKSPVGMGA